MPTARHPIWLTSPGGMFLELSCVGFADRFPPYRTHLRYLHTTVGPQRLAHRQVADRKLKTTGSSVVFREMQNK